MPSAQSDCGYEDEKFPLSSVADGRCFNLETAVRQVRVGWQGATTQRATARQEEQRRQRASWRLNRGASASLHKGSWLVGKILSIHQPFQRLGRGQLPFPG